MNAYVLVELTVKDPAKLSEYSAAAASLVAQFGGQFVGMGVLQDLDGGKNLYQRGAVIQFQDKDAVLAWYTSEAYQSLITLRTQGMDSRFTLLS